MQVLQISESNLFYLFALPAIFHLLSFDLCDVVHCCLSVLYVRGVKRNAIN